MLRPMSRNYKTLGRLSLGALIVAGAAAGFLAVTDSSPATIQGSAHDFSAIDPNQQICVFCHTTHGADTSVQDAPLWNHEVTTMTYQLYNSPTLDSNPSQPQGASRLCLSCHDGSVAVDSYGGQQGVIFMGLPSAVGLDGLQNDHPISITYDDALAAVDSNLYAPSSTPSGLGGTISQDLLFNGQLECASCHDVHNSGTAAMNDGLLVITKVESQLCLTCHNM